METTCYTSIETPLGPVLATADSRSLRGLWFSEHQLHLPSPDERAGWQEDPGHPLFGELAEWLGAYFAGVNPSPDLPMALAGSDFQLAVWQLLREIGYGQTTTYGELARTLAERQGRERPPAARAIGGAVGRNPISLLIPCHRVVGSGGSLVGYGGGLDRKAALLRLEGAL